MSKIKKVNWSCSEYDCYTEIEPFNVDSLKPQDDVLIKADLLIDAMGIMNDFIAQSELCHKISGYSPCVVKALEWVKAIKNN